MTCKPRHVRLFKRLKSMRQIIMAIDKSIPGVANAFSILFLVMSIYAILGVELFGNEKVQFDCRDQYFDSYSQAMLTLTQVHRPL